MHSSLLHQALYPLHRLDGTHCLLHFCIRPFTLPSYIFSIMLCSSIKKLYWLQSVAAVFGPPLSSGRCCLPAAASSSGRRCLPAAAVFGPPLCSGRRCLPAGAVFGPPLSSGRRCLPAAAVFGPLSVADSSWRYGPQSVTVPSVAGSSQSRAAVSHGPRAVTGRSQSLAVAGSHGPRAVTGRSQSLAVAGSRGPQSVTGRRQSRAAVSHGPQSVAGSSGQSRAAASHGQ